VLVPPVLTGMITPSFLVNRQANHPQRSMLYMSPGQGQGEVKIVECPRMPNSGIKGKIGGSPRTLKGIQGLHPGIMLSRAQYVVPPLQLGICRPPWRPHDVSVELKEALWATKKFPENSEGSTGDPW